MPDSLHGQSEHRSLGNRGSKLHDAKLICLHVLARAGGKELMLSDVLARGWPDVFPAKDPWGLLLDNMDGFEEKMALRKHWMRVERDAQVGLRDLRKRALARSRRPEGWSANLWLVTDAGIEWLRVEHELFVASVGADLSALPVVRS